MKAVYGSTTRWCILLLGLIGMAVAGLLGGPTEEREGDEHAQQVANAIRPKLEEKLGANAITEFKVIKYKTQVVAGTNYYIKIQIAPNKYIHAKIFKSLKGEYQLTGLEQDKQVTDEIGSIKKLE